MFSPNIDGYTSVDSVLKDVGTLSCNEYTHGILQVLFGLHTLSYI